MATLFPPQNMLPGDGEVYFFEQFLTKEEADHFFEAFLAGIAWREEEIVIFGKRMMQPRLVAWYGDPGATYAYSGVEHQPLAWTPELQDLKQRVETRSTKRFNSVLLNQYRYGQDSMGWHSDDEPELGRNPVIASLSLGATRRFHFRHRQRHWPNQAVDLTHGSLLLMGGETQHHWQHQVSKTKKEVGPRINLTFRNILAGN